MTAEVLIADAPAVARAAELLRQGELVAFPTETVYGLGAAARNEAAVTRIFKAKGRPDQHPVIVHLKEAAMMKQWAREVPDAADRLAAAFWPGPLTLILPRAAHVLDAVTGGQDSVGLRVPSHPVAQALLQAFGDGIAAPSANRFGHVSATTATHVLEDVGAATALVLDGGACPLGIESTILSFSTGTATLLRPGAIGIDALARVLGYAPATAITEAPRAPGMLASHYAPQTTAWLVDGEVLRAELAQLQDRDERVAVLARSAPPSDDFDGVWIEAADNPEDYGHDLYAHLRALDKANADVILIEAVPEDSAWLAVRDRLTRATHGDQDDRD
jgi:L-threonylcarbamoyladenylate synthase